MISTQSSIIIVLAVTSIERRPTL